MIDMPHVVSSGVVKARSGNYSNCPLKKRPIKYDLADESSDSDNSHNGSSPAPMEISEPENLSTKPEDLRLNLKSGSTSTSPQLTSPPPIGLVAGRGDLSSSPLSYHHPPPPTYCHQTQYSPQYSPCHLPLPEPPLLKFIPSSGGPLEPISMNPPAVWPRVSPFSAFNFANNNSNTGRSQNNYANQHLPYYPKGSNHQQHYNYTPFRGESGSPPHISPPLKTEPSYPIIKQEVVQRMSQLTLENHEVSKPPQIKREVILGNYTPLSRESVISHSHGHSHGHGHGGHSCSSGVSSPTSSTSSSSSCSTGSLPPITTTPTNGGSVRYQCSDCSKSYSTYSGLTKHVQFHCSSQNKKSFICKFCEKVYVSLGALKMHIRTHTLPCKCLHCGKAFSRPWLLQGHIRTHTGEKPFACQHCNRAFADRSNLRAHLQTHSEVKKYSCKACSKTFSRMSLLVKHEDSGCSSTISM